LYLWAEQKDCTRHRHLLLSSFLCPSPFSFISPLPSYLDGGLAVLEGGLAVLQVEGGLAVLVLVLLSEVSVPRFSFSLRSLDPLRMSRLLRRSPCCFSAGGGGGGR
jgi:hypothetical protein